MYYLALFKSKPFENQTLKIGPYEELIHRNDKLSLGNLLSDITTTTTIPIPIIKIIEIKSK